MVDTKDQSSAIVYGILFVNTLDTKIKACNTLNAMFVETLNTVYRSSMVNSKSFVSKVLLQIKQKFKLN